MIKIIAAVGANREIGHRNSLIWRLKGDMEFFKTQTLGHVVVMGANTFQSLPGKLKNRKHYVLSKKRSTEIEGEDVIVFDNLASLCEKVLHIAKTQDVYIIGGACVYGFFIELADELLITEIEASYDKADAFFPAIDKAKFARQVLGTNEENGINYTHVRYVRK